MSLVFPGSCSNARSFTLSEVMGTGVPPDFRYPRIYLAGAGDGSCVVLRHAI